MYWELAVSATYLLCCDVINDGIIFSTVACNYSCGGFRIGLIVSICILIHLAKNNNVHLNLACELCIYLAHPLISGVTYGIF